MKKISYSVLQKKYSGNVVALDRKEQRVVAFGRRFPEIFSKLKAEHIDPRQCVYLGPIQKAGAINVYFVSVRNQADRRRRTR